MNLTRKRSPRKKRSDFGCHLTVEWWIITSSIATVVLLPFSTTDAVAYQNSTEPRENSVHDLTKLQTPLFPAKDGKEIYATDAKFPNDTMANYTGSPEHKAHRNYTANGANDVQLREISNLHHSPAIAMLTANVSEVNMAATESVPRNVMVRYQHSNLNDSMEAVLEEKFYSTTFGNRFNVTTSPPMTSTIGNIDVRNKTQSNNDSIRNIQNSCEYKMLGSKTQNCESVSLNTSSNVANSFSNVSDIKDVQIKAFELASSAENMVSDFRLNVSSDKDNKFNVSDVKLTSFDRAHVAVRNATEISAENTTVRIVVSKNSSDKRNKTVRNRKHKRIMKPSEELSADGSLDDDIIEEYEDVVQSGDKDEYDHTTAKNKLKDDPVDVGAFGVIQKLAEGVLGSLTERIIPKGLRDILKRLQDQNSALETIRLRSKEENGGIGIFGRSILKGLADPLGQWMQGARDQGALDADRGFMAGLASGLASVAGGLGDAFKLRVTAIFPGTLWCGDGHLAQSAEVGLFFLTDNCCKRHDACRLYILAGRSDYGLTNTGLFTRSHCSCDSAFYRCLKRTNTLVSAQIGATYFSILGPQCFKRAHPIVRCVRRTRITGQKCEEYEMDTSQPKIWQWFDSPTF